MNRFFCVLCRQFIENAVAARHQTWRTQSGEVTGWGCEKHFNSMAGPLHEFTSDEIKEQRVQYGKDTIQRYRDGELSREFIETYPGQVKGMIDKGIVTKEEVRKSKEVWKEIKGIDNRPYAGITDVLGKE